MLYLDSPVGSFFGLTIFRDHADPDMFYYASERPRLAMNDGVPEFLFLVYKRDITDNPSLTPEQKEQLGGGFLAFTVDLGVDDEVLKQVRGKLGAIAEGTPKLAPIQYRSGTVRLSIAKDTADAPGAPADAPSGVSFYEQIYGTTKPSLIGDNRATFGVQMDFEGALAMEAALRSGISPIGVIYDLEYLGMRPAFNVKITAEYKRIYEHLEMDFGIRGGVGPIAAAVDIGLAWQKLRENGAIKVEVTNFTDDENFRKQADAAFDWFKTELLRDFFKSSLEPPAFMRPNAAGGGLVGALQSLLGPLSETQQGSRPTLGAPTTEAPTPAAPPTSLESGAESTGARNAAATAPPAPAGGGGAAGPTGSGASFGLQVGFSLKRYEQDELKTREFEYSMQAAVARNAAPQGLFSTFVEGMDLSRAIKWVDLSSDFFKRLNASFSVPGDLADQNLGIDLITVNVEYPGVRPDNAPPKEVAGFQFTKTDQAAKVFRTFLNSGLDLRYRYKFDVHFAPNSVWEGNEPHFSSDWIVTTAPTPQLNPFDIVDTLDLRVVMAPDVPSAEIRQAEVQVVYDDPIHGMHAERSFILSPGAEDESWKLRFDEGGEHGFRYRIIYSLKDNVKYTTDWTLRSGNTVEDAMILVPNPYNNTARIPVFSLLNENTLLEATVDIVHVDADTQLERRERLVFAPNDGLGRGREVVMPTISANPTEIRYATSVVLSDGTVFESPMTAVPIDRKIYISDGPGDVRIVKVALGGNGLAQSNLSGVRVRIESLDEFGDVEEVLFRPNDATTASVTLNKTPDLPFRYRYEVTGYSLMGLPLEGVSGEESTTNLLLPLPVA